MFQYQTPRSKFGAFLSWGFSFLRSTSKIATSPFLPNHSSCATRNLSDLSPKSYSFSESVNDEQDHVPLCNVPESMLSYLKHQRIFLNKS
jgi:hypothetical protein